MKSRRDSSKKEKDILQITAILREIKSRPQEFQKSREYLNSLPSRWQKVIKQGIKNYLPEFMA